MAASQNAEQMLKDLLKWWQKSNPDFTKTAIDSGNKAMLIHLASEKGYVPIVKELIPMGVDVNLPQEYDKMSPLHLATQEKHIEVVKLLLENGANPNVINSVNFTPLHVACENGFLEGTKLLVEKGAKITVFDENGMSPFHVALEDNDVDVCEFILKKAPKLVVQQMLDSIGNYPIHTACKGGNVDMVRLLLKKGSPLTIRNKRGYSPIEVAIQSGTSEVIKMLLQSHPSLINYNGANGRSLLHTAVMYDRIDIAKELLNSGGNRSINAKTSKSKSTPLHLAVLACAKGSKEMVKMLLENDASPNMLDKSGCSPLHVAITVKNTEIVELLVQSKKCNLGIKNIDGKTALDTALEDNQFEISKILSKEMQNILHDNEQSRAKNNQKENECVICFKPKDGIFAFQPCGHARTCEKCTKEIIERSAPCPFCRVEAKNYQKIFL